MAKMFLPPSNSVVTEQVSSQTQARPWLTTAIALMALKVAITLLGIARHHHTVPPIPNTLSWALWWTSKVVPTLFVSALIIDSRQLGNVKYERFFQFLLPATITLTIVVVYSMLHGWHGIQI